MSVTCASVVIAVHATRARHVSAPLPLFAAATEIGRQESMLDALFKAAADCARGAMFVPLILVELGMMFGGKKGATWMINTAVAPSKAEFRGKITALIYLCMFVIVSFTRSGSNSCLSALPSAVRSLVGRLERHILLARFRTDRVLGASEP